MHIFACKYILIKPTRKAENVKYADANIPHVCLYLDRLACKDSGNWLQSAALTLAMLQQYCHFSCAHVVAILLNFCKQVDFGFGTEWIFRA